MVKLEVDPLDIQWFGGAQKNGYRTRVVLQPNIDQSGSWRLNFGQTPFFEGVCASDCRNQSLGVRRLVPLILPSLSSMEKPYWPEKETGSIRHLILETDGSIAESKARIIVSTHGPMPMQQMNRLALRLHEATGAAIYGDALPKRNAGLYAHPKLVVGDEEMRHFAASQRFRVSPKSWWSQSPSSVDAMHQSVRELAALTQEDQVLEIGCGVGTLGNLVGDRVAHWLGVDRERSAVMDAQYNCSDKGTHYEFFVGDGEHWLRKLLGRYHPSVVVLHGMRQRFGTTCMRLLSAMKPARIVYVAPNATSLLTDFKDMSGYELVEMGVVDNTPYSGHCLTIALVAKTLEAES